MKNNAKENNQTKGAQYLLLYENNMERKSDQDFSVRKKLYKNRETDKCKSDEIIKIFRGTIIENFSKSCFIYDITK